MDYINIGTGVTTLRTETLVELLQLCETESVSYLDEVASNTTTQNMAKSVGLEVLALLVKAWNRFKTGICSLRGTGCSHYGRIFYIMSRLARSPELQSIKVSQVERWKISSSLRF
ncbi:uncharacterized protein LOC121783727 isoform X2 [Salvia splendens]|uniref:uncharacterized protein LOC121783727 isoform X2 n=1 Tax=Salvia splendens TaxID=180675 RepID=UPI001C26ADBC|nr:uncharacterized protein LOC121783727 isoform X2 [Salvia splendens]